MSDLKCPKCGTTCERDEADVGIGTIGGPWGCPACHWIEGDYSIVDTIKQAHALQDAALLERMRTREEHIRNHLATIGRAKRGCGQQHPCFVNEEGGVLCACARAFYRWRAFWLLVRGDMEGAPRMLPTVSPETKFTGAIFVHICVCGKRAETWRMGMHGEPLLMEPEVTQWWYTTKLVPEHRRRDLGAEVVCFFTCSRECAGAPSDIV